MEACLTIEDTDEEEQASSSAPTPSLAPSRGGLDGWAFQSNPLPLGKHRGGVLSMNADPKPSSILNEGPNPMEESKSTEPGRDFTLSWAQSADEGGKHNDKEILYRDTLATLFDTVVPFMEHGYERVLKQLLTVSQQTDGEYPIPPRMEILTLMMQAALDQLLTVHNRPSAKRRKRNPFLTTHELHMLASDALAKRPLTEAELDSIPESRQHPDPPAPREEPSRDEQLIIHSLSDDPKHEVEVFDKPPVRDQEDDKIIIRRIKRDIEELRHRNKDSVGSVIEENLECGICYRHFKDRRKMGIPDDCNAIPDDELADLQVTTNSYSIQGLWTTKCGHIFCKECLETYYNGSVLSSRLRRNKSTTKACPVCQKKGTLNECHRVFL